MIFDTHCHLTSSRYKKNLPQIIADAQEIGVSHILIPATDGESAKKAVEIAELYPHIYVGVGIHPHAIEELRTEERMQAELSILKPLLQNKKVLAVGEIGLDATLPELELQERLFKLQLELAIQHTKVVIVHSRGTSTQLLEILKNYMPQLSGKIVFHCCEAKEELLTFAIKHSIFIGVDGDVTFDETKQNFVPKIPLELLVVETDAPYLLPEPLRAQKAYPNVPKNIVIIIEKIAALRNTSMELLLPHLFKNSLRLFNA